MDAINNAERERVAAKAELEHISGSDALSAAEIHAMIDSLGDIGQALADPKPATLARLYDSLGFGVALCAEGAGSSTAARSCM